MATNYPTTLDSFTDPGPLSTMDGATGGSVVYHDQQHANLNDAVEALEAAVGITGSFKFLLATAAASGDLSGNFPNPTVAKINGVSVAQFAVTVTGNAGTVPVSSSNNLFVNSSSATMTITMATAGANPGQPSIVQILDHAAVAQTIAWVGIENSTVTAPVTSNGSITLPLTVAFMFNSLTNKMRCVGYA